MDDSLKLQIDYLEENMDKFNKIGSERKYNSNFSLNVNHEIFKNQIQGLEEDLKKIKSEMNEKDIVNYSLNLQVSELTNSNKFLNDLCENMKNQLKR